MVRALSYVLCVAWVLCVPSLSAQVSADFDKTSLALRTALHFDPAADGPLKKLVELYVTAGKRTELPGLYVSHLSQYPQDESARVVLARLFLELNDERAADFLRESIAQHPQSALLAWTNHHFLTSRFEPRALDELDRAISIEKSASRRALWLADLLKLAAAHGKEELVINRFKVLAADQTLTAEQRIRWARQALTRSLPKAVASVLEGADLSSLQGDVSVEAALVLAETDAANGRRAEAGKRLDELLGKLAADYWRRREVLLLRLQVAGDAADRDQLIAGARKRFEATPESESEAVALADLLSAAQRKSEAIDVLQKAAKGLPESRLIETRLLDLFDATNRESSAIEFLTERLSKQPAREDLALHRLRLLLATGRSKEGVEAMDLLLKDKTPEQRASVHLDTARWLRSRNLLSESAAVLERLISDQPQRWEARKELGELYAVLKRGDDLEKLFAVKLADNIAPEVRMEVVQFLMAQKQWAPARAALEQWVESRKAELEGRLLLARICAITGDQSRASSLIAQSRELCDTDARYASWLNAAFTLAGESEREPEFVEEERQRIWPRAGESWDAARLSRLLALTELAGNAKLDAETEKLVRAALADASLKEDQRRDLQLRLLDVIDRQSGREKEVETQLVALAKTPGANVDDLNLRLALLYHSAQRFDLAVAIFEKLNISACQDAKLLSRGAAASTEAGSMARAAEMLQRVVQLQPDEMGNWVQWTSALASLNDEHTLRLALRQMLSMSVKWKLHADSLDLLRRHLAASCWREAGRLICREPLEPVAAQRALIILDEAERLETVPERKHWVAWTKAWLGGKEAKDSLRFPGVKWIPFPDGLMLSAAHAAEMLSVETAEKRPPLSDAGSPPLAPLDLAWGYESEPGTKIQRFTISPDGDHVLVADDWSQLSVLDRLSGKLRWTTATIKSRPTAPPQFNPNVRSERVLQPLEFVANAARVFLLINGQVECRSLADGQVEWSKGLAVGTGGDMLAIGDGLVFHWQPGGGTLDAYHLENGKLAWTRVIEPLKKQPAQQLGYGQTWIAAGVSSDAGKVLAYGNGAAVMRASDGALLWQTSAEDSPAFPLELRGAEEETPSVPITTTIMPWVAPVALQTMGVFFNGNRAPFNPLVIRRAYSHPMNLNLGGYAGMYGGAPGATFLNWGSEGVRVLRGQAIWSLSTGTQPTRVSVSGLPVISDSSALENVSGMLVGFAGGVPVMVNDAAVSRGAAMLWQGRSVMRTGAPGEQSFPAAALQGRTLLVASADGLLARDAVTGAELLRCELPQAAQLWAKGAWDQLKSFQSVRWSARGVVFYDGQGSSLVVDWRSAAHGGDWIVPLGLDKLGCLRGAGAKQTASLEAVK